VRCPADRKRLPVAGPQYSPSSYTSSSSFLCRPSPHLTGSYQCPSTPGSTQSVARPAYGISPHGYVPSGSPSPGRSSGTTDRSSPVSPVLGGSFSDSFNVSYRVQRCLSSPDSWFILAVNYVKTQYMMAFLLMIVMCRLRSLYYAFC